MAPENDIPETAHRRIRKAAERAYADLRWLLGDHELAPAILLHLAEDSWRAGRAHGAERDL